jgi:tetratricopeptide (TPR) repeat protein
MAANRQWWVLFSGRRGILVGVLALAVLVLVFRWDELALAYRISAAQRALRVRDFGGAITALEKSRARGNSSPNWHYLTAVAQRRAGRLVEAESHLAAAERLGWSPAEIRRERLLARAQSGHIKELESQLVDLLSHPIDDQGAEEIYEAMARGYLTAFHVEDAARCLKFWREFQPANPVAHWWTAELYARIEKREAAINELREVLRLQPDNHEAAIKLAQYHLDLSNLDEAAVLFEQCVPISGLTEDAHLGLAECRRSQGSIEEAKSHLYDALVFDMPPPKAARALAVLGQFALEDRQPDRAISLLEESVALNPQDAKSRLALAAAFIAVDQSALAESHRAAARQITERNRRLVRLTRRVATESYSPDLRSEIGSLLIEMNMPVAGVEWLKTAVLLDPGHPQANKALADFYQQIGAPKQAAQYAAAARNPAPDSTSNPDKRGKP